MARKRRRDWDTGRFHFNNKDGLEINNLNRNRVVSRRQTRFSMWDDDHIVIDDPHRKNRYIHVSIHKKVASANSARCSYLNWYNKKVNGRQ